MKLKSLMLGVAAAATATVTATTGQAADLPVAPEPVDYVRICDAYGARFYYIPGTETCLRVGGRVRTTFTVNNVQDGGPWQTRTSDGYDWETEGYLYLDAFTETAFGTLRTFVELEGNVNNAVEAFDTNNMFIEWGGLTAGYRASQFDHYTGQVFIGSITRNWSDTTTQQLAYTASFGNGFYVTASVEERKERDNNAPVNTTVTSLTNGVTGTSTISTATGGTRIPDFVGAIGVTQGWGAAKLSGALHQIYPGANNTTVGSFQEDELGWAIGGSVLFDLAMLSPGSNIFFQGFYADGALSYIGVTGGATDSMPGMFDSNGAGSTSKGYSLSSGIYYQATSTVGLALDGSYADVDGAGTINDQTRWAIDGSAQWEPVSGLILGGNVGYADRDVQRGTDVEELVFGARIQRTF